MLWAWLWIGSMGVVCLVALLGEQLAPAWRRRLQRLEAGRRRQAAEWRDAQDAERRAAAEWIAKHCFWSQR
jgi:uncharacterized membrane protein